MCFGGNLANMIVEISKDHLERQMGLIVEENSRGLKKVEKSVLQKKNFPFLLFNV